MSYNYLKNNNNTGTNGGGAPRQRIFVRSAPDETMHTAPGAMYIIGGLGVIAGIAANIWQLITTFTALWSMFNPAGSPINYQRQPAIFCICGLISFSFQFALTMLTWRLDTSWKKHNMRVGSRSGADGSKKEAIKNTAVEIVQHVSLALIWGGLGFVVDTIGDFMFISFYTQYDDPSIQVFLIFLYATSLYALSTIAFVRSVEYITAGIAAARALAHEK